MKIIQTKKIEFHSDCRGWSIKPISDERIRNENITNLHIVSIKPNAIRGNHYHLHMTEQILIIGGTCRITVQDRKTNQKEEIIIENNAEMLLIFPPLLTHAIENIGSEMAYLFCYSNIDDDLQKHGTVKDNII